jgi:hypothetical protein
MTDRVLPVLFPEDYLAFRQLAPSLPDTFDAWKAAHIEELRAAYRSGEMPIDVVVQPDAFIQFLRRHGSKASLKTLEAFAIEKAAGR